MDEGDHQGKKNNKKDTGISFTDSLLSESVESVHFYSEATGAVQLPPLSSVFTLKMSGS